MRIHKSAICFVVWISVASGSSCRNPVTISPVKKYVVETDGVLDDIVALIMILQAKKYGFDGEACAITCVSGVSTLENCVINVLKTLKSLNITDIPVYAGASSPFLEPNEIYDAPLISYGDDGFGDFEYVDPPSTDLLQKTHSVNALVDLVKKHPGKVTVIAMAPLTNIALAIKMYPRFPKDVQQLIIMGGSVEGRGNVRISIDFNSGHDMIANHIVMKSVTSKLIHFVPLETTDRARTSMKFRLSLNDYNNTRSWLLRQGERIALKPEDGYWYCPDAVAVAVAITSGSIVTKSSPYYVDAIYEGEKTRGMTLVDYTHMSGYPPNVNLIQEIDVMKYKQLLFESFK